MALQSIDARGGNWPGVSSSLGEVGLLRTISSPVVLPACCVCSFLVDSRLALCEMLAVGFQGGWLGCALCVCGRMGLDRVLRALVDLCLLVSALKVLSEYVVRFEGAGSCREGDLRLLVLLDSRSLSRAFMPVMNCLISCFTSVSGAGSSRGFSRGGCIGVFAGTCCCGLCPVCPACCGGVCAASGLLLFWVSWYSSLSLQMCQSAICCETYSCIATESWITSSCCSCR